MSVILGVDPGSRKTGFGVIEKTNQSFRYIVSGIIRMSDEPLPARLQQINSGLLDVIEEYHPDEMAIEQVFMAKNASSALKLGQARGAAIVAATSRGLPVAEYEARKIKQSVVGHGGADKHQVQQMVQQLLNLSACPREDAADALAAAICHANTRQLMSLMKDGGQYRRGRVI